MKEVLLLCSVAAVFVFGFFIMKRLDKFLENNHREIDEMTNASVLRIAVENPFMIESVSDLLERFSKKNPYCQLYLITGNAEEIASGLAANELDFGFISSDDQKNHAHEYAAVFVPLKQGAISTTIGIPVMPIASEPIMTKVLWKKEECTLEKKQFAELLRQCVSTCTAVSDHA